MKVTVITTLGALAFASVALAAPTPGFGGNLMAGLGIGAGAAVASNAVNGVIGAFKGSKEKKEPTPTPTVTAAPVTAAATPAPCPAAVADGLYYEHGAVVHYSLDVEEPYEVLHTLSPRTTKSAAGACRFPLSIGKPYRIKGKWVRVAEADPEDVDADGSGLVVKVADTKAKVLQV